MDNKFKGCELCKSNLCKTKLYNEYLRRNSKKYEQVFFICDGNNDYCLSSHLSSNDSVFVRKGFGLYGKLKDIKCNNNIKASISYWIDLYDVFKEIKDLI